MLPMLVAGSKKGRSYLATIRIKAAITRIQMDLPRLCNVSLEALIVRCCPKQKGAIQINIFTAWLEFETSSLISGPAYTRVWRIPGF